MARHTWYSRLASTAVRDRTGVAQVEDRLRKATRVTLPEHVLRLAQAEYEHQYGNHQDYERMQERHGLGVLEVVALLADLADRHGAKPTRPRASGVAAPEGGDT